LIFDLGALAEQKIGLKALSLLALQPLAKANGNLKIGNCKFSFVIPLLFLQNSQILTAQPPLVKYLENLLNILYHS
jgi:hypothetical protein